MDIAAWLRDLGLARYEEAFRDNDIDADVLADLTEADLEKLGISLGHRKKLLKAIAELGAPSSAAAASSLPASSPDGAAERRGRGRAAAADGDVLRPGRARPSWRRGSIPRTWGA